MKAQSRSSSTPIRRFKSPVRERLSERWTKARVLRELKLLANPRVREKMAYFGVRVPKALGISTPRLHSLARRIGKNQQLAEKLWRSGVHEARIQVERASVLGGRFVEAKLGLEYESLNEVSRSVVWTECKRFRQ